MLVGSDATVPRELRPIRAVRHEFARRLAIFGQYPGDQAAFFGIRYCLGCLDFRRHRRWALCFKSGPIPKYTVAGYAAVPPQKGKDFVPGALRFRPVNAWSFEGFQLPSLRLMVAMCVGWDPQLIESPFADQEQIAAALLIDSILTRHALFLASSLFPQRHHGIQL